jgi:hypothetical protein
LIEHLDELSTDSEWVKFGQLIFLVHKRLPLLVMVTSVPLVLTSALSAAEALIGLLSLLLPWFYSLKV